MDRGSAFLRSQVSIAVAQHGMLLRALENHENQADDLRFRDLCSRHVPRMRDDQRTLEEYQSQLGADAGTGQRSSGVRFEGTRELADAARESDFLRLVGDLSIARQAEDMFRTFREAGRMMGNRTLQEIGDAGERHQDAYVKEASRLVQHLFVEYAQGIDGATRKSTAFYLDMNP